MKQVFEHRLVIIEPMGTDSGKILHVAVCDCEWRSLGHDTLERAANAHLHHAVTALRTSIRRIMTKGL